MTWFKVDDRLAFHRKTIQAGNAAMGAWVRLGSWSSAYETDGCLTQEIVSTIATPDELAKLLEVGFVRKRPSGEYDMHDFLHYNPASKALNSNRNKWAKQKRRQRSVSTVDNQADIVQRPDDSPNGTPGRDGTGIGSGSGSRDPDGDSHRGAGLAADLAQAFADGVADGAGAPWRMPDANVEAMAISDAVFTHKPQLRGQALLDWVKRSAATYRRAMAGDAKFQKGFRPTKWLEWLNAGQPDSAPRPGPSRAIQPAAETFRPAKELT